jgi:superfamily II DNA/RNA helicase
MADMGFFPQVEWLLRRVPDDRQTLLFSATLDREVDVLVRRYMRNPVRHEVVSETQTVEEMTHRFLKVHEMDRVKVLAAIAAGVARTMVFVRTKRGVDRLVSQLKREGVNAAAIHGDLRQSAREQALKDFGTGHHAVLVATDVAARGIHVDDVDIVVHFDPPEEHKGYVHRSGRTARAGREGVVVTFVLWNQELEVERLQKRVGLRQPIVEVFSNDVRLADLASIDGPAPRRRAQTADAAAG